MNHPCICTIKSHNQLLLLIVVLVGLLPIFSRAQSIKKYPLPPAVASSFRGLSVINDSVAWVSGSKGWVGHSSNRGLDWEFNQVPGFEALDFRSLYAFNDSTALIANAGSPAHILRTTDGGKTWQSVYTNSASAIFIDGVDFWNDQDGVMYGDPMDGQMFLLFTKDGGRTWYEPPLETRPKLNEGEASFAASGTGIRCYGKQRLVIATGGKTSRLFISDNRGKTWRIATPPVLQGKESAGIFSVAFRNNKVGVVVGGDFAVDTLRTQNAFYTKDAGKTWKEFEIPPAGYRECVEYLPPYGWLTTGPTGTENLTNHKWNSISTEKGFHVVRKARTGSWVIMAGNKVLGYVVVN